MNELPGELQFNVNKYMSHPVADLIREEIEKCKICMDDDNKNYNI